ncbi:MAG TPA: alpha/beta hydrolase [Enhygromyxa sp.]|nr:alpha/beta hydrolase [Enhygromyxa sp.]
MAQLKTPVAQLAQQLLRNYPGRRDEALAVLNGAIGDRLHDAGSSLAVTMQLFHGREPWLLEDPPLTVPEAGPDACLFVHGLMGSERAWRFGVAEQRGTVDYGAAIAERLEQTAIYARYNTGRHISQNGRELAERLEQLVDVWPEPGLESLTIVAHSMGGLVTRSACHYGLEAGHRWIERLRRVFLLGVPSRGAPLEFLAHVTAFTLETIWNPWTKVIGKVINGRSAGIKDLRHGFVLDEDWRYQDIDRLAYPVPKRPREPSHVRWYVAIGSLGQPGGVAERLLGDGLVRPGSAQGRSLDPRERELLAPAEVRMFEATSHLDLMNDPDVLAQILAWWEPPAQGSNIGGASSAASGSAGGCSSPSISPAPSPRQQRPT